MYGKLINNNLFIAPRRLTVDGCMVFNPTDAQYEAAGYLPVIHTLAPEAPEGYYAKPHWGEQGGGIVEVWAFVPNPEPAADESLTRYANELTGENDPDLVAATESLITKFTEE